MAEGIEFENGLMVYFSGSTALTMDMELWTGVELPARRRRRTWRGRFTRSTCQSRF